MPQPRPDATATTLATLATAIGDAHEAAYYAREARYVGSAADCAAALEDEARAAAARDAALVDAIPALVAALTAAVELASRAAAKARDSVDAPMPSPACDLNLADAGEALPAIARAATRAACDLALARELRVEATHAA